MNETGADTHFFLLRQNRPVFPESFLSHCWLRDFPFAFLSLLFDAVYVDSHWETEEIKVFGWQDCSHWNHRVVCSKTHSDDVSGWEERRKWSCWRCSRLEEIFSRVRGKINTTYAFSSHSLVVFLSSYTLFLPPLVLWKNHKNPFCLIGWGHQKEVGTWGTHTVHKLNTSSNRLKREKRSVCSLYYAPMISMYW